MKTYFDPDRRSVPAIPASKHTDKPAEHSSVFHWFMMVCCVAMIAGVGLIILAAPKDQPLTQVLWAASPMLACLGLHLVMHKLVGMSCHSGKSKHPHTSKKDSNP